MLRAPTHPPARCWSRPAVFLLLVFMALAGPAPASAQESEAATFTLMLRGVPLEQALEELVAATQINLVYEAGLMRDTRVFCAAHDASAEALLRCALRGTDLDFYRTSSGTYVLIEAIRQPPRRGRLVGIVVDEATGEPLPDANVLLAEAGVGTASNGAGQFSFSGLVVGAHRVVVTYVGYEAAVDSVWVLPGESTRQRIALRARSVATAPIVVNGLQQRLPSRGLGQGLLTAAHLAAPGTAGAADVARGASSLMGVALQEPLADLHIQGGGPGEHQMQLDGTPVRNPVTLGRLLGAFSPLAIERLVVHKAGFGAEHGSLVSGIVAAEHALRTPSDGRLTLQVDPLSINGRAQGRFDWPGQVTTTAMVAARTSLWSLYRDPTLDDLFQRWHSVDPLLLENRLGTVPATTPSARQPGADVAFSDVHAAARVRLGSFHQLHASLYRGHNQVDAEFLTRRDPSSSLETGAGDDLVLARDRYHWTNWAGQLRHEWLWGARAMSMLRLYGSRQSLGHGYQVSDAFVRAAPAPSAGSSALLFDTHEREDAVVARPYEGNRIRELGLEATLDYSAAARHQLSGALEVRHLSGWAEVDELTRPLLYTNADWLLSAYIEDEVSLGLHTTLETGVRLTYAADRQTVYAEPRLAVRYDGAHAALGDYAFRLAGGLYRQFVNRFDLSSAGPTAIVPSTRFWLPVDHSRAPSRAYHVAAEGLYKPTAAWQIDVEGYYKHQPHLLVVDYPALLDAEADVPYSAAQSDFVTPSRGRALGGGLRVRRSGKRLESTLGYSYSHTRRRFPGRFEGRLMPVPWNQPHRLSLQAGLALTSALTARLNWRGVWGRTWGFRQAYYDYLTLQAAPGAFAPFDLSDPSEHTLPPFYRLDAGLAYTHDWNSISVQVQADLINVLDRPNTFDWSLRPTDAGFEKIARLLPGRRPLLSVRLSY